MKSQAGISLIGVMIAGSLVALVLIALPGLVFQIGATTQLARETHVATLLAREGLELVRSLRDDNWLFYERCGTGNNPEPCAMQWRGDPSGDAGMQRRAICNGTWIIDLFSSADGGDTALAPPSGAAPEGELFLRLADGLYTHVYVRDVETPATPFSRVITVSSPEGGECGESYSFADNDEILTTPPPVNRAQIQADVTWQHRQETEADGSPRIRRVRLVTDLYPWLDARSR